MTFYEWLLTQVDREDPVGDLAMDAREDDSFPDGDEDGSTYVEHLKSATASPEALQALKDAYFEFSGTEIDDGDEDAGGDEEEDDLHLDLDLDDDDDEWDEEDEDPEEGDDV